MEPRRPTSMVRAAVRPRMLVLLVVLLAAAAVCARLGAWQLDRAQARGEQAQQSVAREDAPPVPLDDVLAPQTSFAGDLLGRAVRVTGTYEADGQLVVADRALGGRTGSLVVTPLRVAGGAGEGAVLPVARGWVASPDDAGSPPAGEVVVTGFLRPAEAAGALDVAAGTAESISTAQLVNVWGGPTYTGYLVLTASSPAQDAALTPLPPPPPRGGGGVDFRNLGYAVQWWIFGVFAVLLWLRLVRDEAQGEPEPEPEPQPRPDGEPGADPGPGAEPVPGRGAGDPGAGGAVREPAGGASA